MKDMRKVLIGVLLGVLVTISLVSGSRAQNTTLAFQVAPGTTSANCSIVASQTVYCLTGGGTIFVSVNGGAFAAYSSGVAGVTSVNGKTGAVVLGATSTTTTSLQ